jgi:hypothetical protein
MKFAWVKVALGLLTESELVAEVAEADIIFRPRIPSLAGKQFWELSYLLMEQV